MVSLRTVCFPNSIVPTMSKTQYCAGTKNCKDEDLMKRCKQSRFPMCLLISVDRRLLTLFTPLPQTTSVTKEMSDYHLWCYVVGDNVPFLVTASSSTFIGQLKKLIREERKNSVLSSVDAKDLTLWKVRMTFLAIRSDITGDKRQLLAHYICRSTLISMRRRRGKLNLANIGPLPTIKS